MTLRALFQTGGTVDDDEADNSATPASTPPPDDDDEQTTPGPDLALRASLDTKKDLLAARSAVEGLNKSTEDARRSLREAREKLLARKYDRTAALLAIATGLTRPTHTGGFSGFAESIGNMGAALQEPVSQKREFERQKIQDILDVDKSMYGLDEKTAEAAIKLAQIRARQQELLKEPASIQLIKFMEGLPPDKRIRALEALRNPGLVAKENEGVLSIVDPNAIRHPELPATRPLTTLGREAAAQHTLSEEKEAGKTTGEKVATAQFNLPDTEAKAKYAVDLLTRLKNHPGMPYAVGATSVFPTVPGSDAADFHALLDQLGGQQMLDAYNYLRGTGSITEFEGTSAKAAEARMQTAQSEKEFVNAANEYISILTKAAERARLKAQSGTAPSTSATAKTPRLRYDRTGKRLQ